MINQREQQYTVIKFYNSIFRIFPIEIFERRDKQTNANANVKKNVMRFCSINLQVSAKKVNFA